LYIFILENINTLKTHTRKSKIHIQVYAISLLILLIFHGISGFKLFSKLTNLSTDNSKEEFYFSYTIPVQSLPLNLKSETFFSNYSLLNDIKIISNEVLLYRTHLNYSYKISYFDIIIKVRYYCPVYVFLRIFRI